MKRHLSEYKEKQYSNKVTKLSKQISLVIQNGNVWKWFWGADCEYAT